MKILKVKVEREKGKREKVRGESSLAFFLCAYV